MSDNAGVAELLAAIADARGKATLAYESGGNGYAYAAMQASILVAWLAACSPHRPCPITSPRFASQGGQTPSIRTPLGRGSRRCPSTGGMEAEPTWEDQVASRRR